MSANYFFESIQSLSRTDADGRFYTETQRVHLRRSAGSYPMGIIAKTPSGNWVHSAPPQPGRCYSTRKEAANALYEWFGKHGFGQDDVENGSGGDNQ